MVQSDNDLHDLTNLNNMEQFEALETCIAQSSLYETISNTIKTRLPMALLLCLTKLKLNLDFKVLGILFRFTNVVASTVFFEMVRILRTILDPIVSLTTKDNVEKNMPFYFINELESTYIVLDGMETEIAIPSCLHCKIVSYSRYKSK